MRQVKFPVTVDIHGNLIDNNGEIVAKPVEGFNDSLSKLVSQVAAIDFLGDIPTIVITD